MKQFLLAASITLSFCSHAFADSPCSALYGTKTREYFICDHYVEKLNLNSGNINMHGFGNYAAQGVIYLPGELRAAGFHVNPQVDNTAGITQLLRDLTSVDTLSQAVRLIAIRTK